jgi:hypothetical protein
LGQTSEILKIQNEYLRLLESYFQKEREELVATNQPIVDYVVNLFSTRSPSLLIPHGAIAINPAEYKMLSLIEEVDQFWKINAEQLRKQLAESELLILDISCQPWQIEQAVRQYGIYFDTLCIPCPLYLEKHSLEGKLDSDRRLSNFAYFFSCYISIINTMRKLIAKCYPPLFVVFPSKYYLSEDEIQSIFKNRIQKDSPKLQLIADRFYFHLQKVFAEFLQRDFDFEGVNEAMEFVEDRGLATIRKEKFLGLVKLVNVDSMDIRLQAHDVLRGDLSARVIRDISELKQGKVDPSNIDAGTWLFLWNTLMVELISTETIYLDSCYFGIDSYFFSYQWELYRWKLSNESKEIRKSLKLSETDVAAYTISNKLQWLSSLPLEVVVAIRSDDNLSFVRQMFRENKKLLAGVGAEELENISDQIANDIKKRISDFNSYCVSKKKDFHKSLAKSGSLLASTCALSVASVVFPLLIPLAITSSVFTVVFGVSAMDLYKEYRAGKLIMQKLNRSPIGFFAAIAEKGTTTNS